MKIQSNAPDTISAPVGVCFPSSGRPARFTKNISFRYGLYKIVTKGYKKTNECNPQSPENTGPQFKMFPPGPPTLAYSQTFRFALKFKLNPDWREGQSLNNVYICENVSEYRNEFNVFMFNLVTVGNEIARRGTVTERETRTSCSQGCGRNRVYGWIYTQNKTVTTIVNPPTLLQTIAPGCR
jgi:hypothetical protein